MSERGGAGARGVIIGTRAKAKGVGRGEGVSGGELDGGGEEAAVPACEDATDEGRGPVAIRGLTAGDVTLGGRRGRRRLATHGTSAPFDLEEVELVPEEDRRRQEERRNLVHGESGPNGEKTIETRWKGVWEGPGKS